MHISYLNNTSSPLCMSVTSSVKPAVVVLWGTSRCDKRTSTQNGSHPAEGVRVLSTGFDVMAGSVCSVVTDVFCYNGTHKASFGKGLILR